MNKHDELILKAALKKINERIEEIEKQSDNALEQIKKGNDDDTETVEYVTIIMIALQRLKLLYNERDEIHYKLMNK